VGRKIGKLNFYGWGEGVGVIICSLGEGQVLRGRERGEKKLIREKESSSRDNEGGATASKKQNQGGNGEISNSG